jgi:hypothetical protein
VRINRRNGFAQELELSAEGLPAGVTAAGKGSGNALTLRLTAETGARSGPFRVVAKVKGRPGVSRLARAAVAEMGGTTADLWLTVAPTK